MDKDRFNHSWNPYYDFAAPANLTEIAAVETYRLEEDHAFYTAGQIVESPWGSNQVIEARHEAGEDVCIKKITVKPGFMLSLQRHRGREELWEVTDGVLTVIKDGERHDIHAGNSIFLKKGSVHCMINSSDAPVTIIETQRGICREKDNIRLLDFNNRPTYPLTTENEFKSAKLYARIQAEHAKRYGFDNLPPEELLSE
jgi:mannose-6-phosphate isomerase-like protein (cupin superfamily)